MANRRLHKKKENQRLVARVFRPFFILTLLIFSIFYSFILGYQYLMRPDVLPFKNVILHSSLQYIPIDKIKEVVTENIKGGFFSFDQRQLRQALLARPWIKKVGFRRLFPATLEVNVQQRQPVAYWGRGGLLSQDGVVFYPKFVHLSLSLPHLDGPLEDSQWLYSVYQICNQLLSQLKLSIKSIDLNQRLTLKVVLSNDVLVILNHSDWKDRFSRFVALYFKIQVRNGEMVQQVDLRYPNGVAVKYH